jgi:hypothetical protein
MGGRWIGLVLTAFVMAGCNKGDEASSSIGQKSPGRYAGIGTFEAGRLWQEMKGAPASQDPTTANLADDEHIIVVLDSHTGEIRQCGDHSGFCVAMNPWTGTGNVAGAPVKLAKHAANLDMENQNSTESSASKSDRVLNETTSGR